MVTALVLGVIWDAGINWCYQEISSEFAQVKQVFETDRLDFGTLFKSYFDFDDVGDLCSSWE